MFYFVLFLLWISIYNSVGNREKRIVCIGDSITFGSGVSSSTRNISSYPAKLQQLLNGNSIQSETSWLVKNLGFRGATATNKSRLSYQTSQYFSEAAHFSPDYVVVMLGTNDMMINVTHKIFREDFTYLLTSFQTIGSQPTVLLMLPPWLDVQYPSRAERFKYVMQDPYQQIIRAIATEQKLLLLNAYSIFEHKTHLLGDGIHPNAEGCSLIAQLVFQALETIGAVKSIQSRPQSKTGGNNGSKRSPSQQQLSEGVSLRGDPKFLGRQAHFFSKDRKSKEQLKSNKKSNFWFS